MGQQPVSVHLIEKDGLPDIEFYDIVEDNKGVIWLAADKGLYCYDGKTFKNYSHPKKRGLSVFGLKLDDKNRVWCNNISGQYFYVENDSLHLFTDLKKHTKGQLATFFFYKEKLIASSYPKILQVDLQSKEVNLYSEKYELSSYAFKNNDTLFHISQDKIKYSINNQSILEKQKLSIDSLQALYWNHTYFKEKLLLFGFNYMLEETKVYFSKKGEYKELKFPNFRNKQKIENIYVEDNLLWLSTNKGLYIYGYENNKFTYKKTYFKNQKIGKVLKDSNANYWVTTLSNGVYIIPNKHIQQYKLLKDYTNITTIEKVTSDKLIIGSEKGKLAIVNINTSQVDTLAILSDKKVTAIANRGNNEVLVSFTNKAFVLDENSTNKSRPKRIDRVAINAKDISAINNNMYILAGYAYASLIDTALDTDHRLNNKRAYTSYYSQGKKEIYIGYVDGVEMYKEDLKPIKITFNKQPVFAIDIDETANGIIWVSTFNDGLIGIENGKAIYNYTVKNGLLSNQTGVIKADGNYLWVATDKSIQQFNTETKRFKNLTKKDGITSFNISDISVFEDKICFSSNKGLFQLDKDKVFKTQSLSDFYFTNVLVEDKSVAIQSVYNLASDVSKIQFQFHSNGYLSEENSIYQYRLLGTNEEWFNVSKGVNEVVFNSLSGGSYMFQLKAVENNGAKETPVQAIEIKINLPFYKESWFILSVFLLTLFLIWQYFSWREKTLKEKQKETLEKERITKRLVASQLESLRSQMNPHFIFNALNSIQEYIVLNEKHLASAFLVKFSRLIRLYLEHSQEHYISLAEEVKALELYLELEKDRFEETLSYAVNCRKELNLEKIKVPSIFIQPYVENALKHGLLHKKTNRKLIVSFGLNESNNTLQCIIEDNGIGRKASDKMKVQRAQYHKSYATKANQKRIDLINIDRIEKIVIVTEDLYDNNKKAIGTKVIISIPF